MDHDDHLQNHLDHCEAHCQRLKAEGTWPWSDSLKPAANAKIERLSRKSSQGDLTEESAAAIRELVRVLRDLHRRLSDDGYELVDGRYHIRQPTEYDKKPRPGHPDQKSDQAR